ncbi:MAG: hypothetical protein ACYTGS_09495, partial [Planctomycetota bacterium]
MMKKEVASVAKFAVCMLVVLSLCLIPSCKKSEEPTPTDSEHPEHPVTTTTPAPASTAPKEPEVAKAADVPAG